MMNRVIIFKRKIDNAPILKALLVNALACCTIFLLFEPTAKSDDYDMTTILYGAVNGEYSPFILYSNVIWGRILVAFLNVWPNIPWYYILQFALMLSALISTSYILIERSHISGVMLMFILFAVEYEFFIRFTFTKTCGLVIACGYFWILYLIETKDKITPLYFIGIFYVLAGCLIRGGMFQLLSVVFLSGFVIYVICHRSGEKKQLIFKILLFIVVVIVLYLVSDVLGKYNTKAYNEDNVWGNYLIDNGNRSALVDYTVPDYDLYQEEYEKLGISKNDYSMWFEIYNRGDDEKLSQKMITNIRLLLSDEKEDGTLKKISKATKNLPSYLTGNIMFYLFLIGAISLILSGRTYRWLILGCITATSLFGYYYLYMMGRVQHHVDVAIFWAAFLLTLFYCDLRNDYKVYVMLISMMGLEVIAVFNSELVSHSYYGTSTGNYATQKEWYSDIYEELALLRDDKEHLYMFNAGDSYNCYSCFTVFEVIEKDFYHNIYRTNMNHIPVFKNVLSDFGITNPFKEMTNSDTIYYYISEDLSYQMDTVLNYVQENYDKDVKMTLVKQMDDSEVYQFYDDNFMVADSDAQEMNDQIVYDADVSIKEDMISVSGYIYEDGTDSFSQNVYLKTIDDTTGETRYYLTTQEKNRNLESRDKYNGLYSAFSYESDADDEDGIDIWENSDVYLLLKNSNGLYEVQIK